MIRSWVIAVVAMVQTSFLCSPAWATFSDGPLKIRSIPISATPGDRINVGIQTTPKARCSIEVRGQGILQDMALQPQVADKTGLAEWTFELSRYYKADRLPIIVTSSAAGGVDRKIVTAIPITGAKNPLCRFKFELEPVKAIPGQDVLLAVRAVPGTSLRLEAQDAGQGLVPGDQLADKGGRVTWRFRLAPNYKADILPLVVTGQMANCQRKLIAAVPVTRESKLLIAPKPDFSLRPETPKVATRRSLRQIIERQKYYESTRRRAANKASRSIRHPSTAGTYTYCGKGVGLFSYY